MKFRLAALALLGTAYPAAAHDFWLQPLRFQVAQRSDLPMTFQVGHGQFRQRWGLGLDRILLLRDIGPASSHDLRSAFRASGSADVVARFDDVGLHAVVMQSGFAQSELPAIRFNDYAKAEGLTAILAYRDRANATRQPGRERYSRRAKALIQVGPQGPGNARLATRPIGLKLEIVPDRNPYALGDNRMLPIHVLYNDKRLAGATVKLTSLEFDAKPVEVAITDARGQATFRVPPVGDWLLNVIWSEPIKGNPTIDFDTTFSSLTFGYNPGKH